MRADYRFDECEARNRFQLGAAGTEQGSRVVVIGGGNQPCSPAPHLRIAVRQTDHGSFGYSVLSGDQRREVCEQLQHDSADRGVLMLGEFEQPPCDRISGIGAK